ncbi:MAG: hypothetical protein ACP6IS_03120 [Candidatus Asgardarchaeia archaeon]
MLLAVLVISKDGTPLATIKSKNIQIDSTVISGAIRVAKEIITTFTGVRKDLLQLSDGLNHITMYELKNKDVIVVFVSKNGNPTDKIKMEHIKRMLEIYELNEDTMRKVTQFTAKKPKDYRFLAWGDIW